MSTPGTDAEESNIPDSGISIKATPDDSGVDIGATPVAAEAATDVPSPQSIDGPTAEVESEMPDLNTAAPQAEAPAAMETAVQAAPAEATVKKQSGGLLDRLKSLIGK